jgi:tetratricopeptide (TPR) repeat protein
MDKATQIISDTLSQYPKSPQAHVAAGDLAAGNKNNAEAIAQWNQALAIDKDYAPALIRLGQASLATGRNEDAITYLKHYTDINPDAQGYGMLGQAYVLTHDYGRARDACSHSFDIQRAPGSLACIGGADYQLKNYSEAARVFDVLAQGAPQYMSQNPQLLYIAGKSYENTHQKTKAIAMYKQLLPYVKKGTSMHNQIQQTINTLSHSKS